MSMDKIVLGGGCFWCLESVLQQIIGVQSVLSGYAGGHDLHPNYENVCNGKTGHAEVVEVCYDSTQISLKQLLLIFFHLHDPTTLNRQGNDIGTQYRSIILYATPQQKALADSIIAELQQNGVFQNPIVTQVEALQTFYPAEDYHQNYFAKNPMNPYCQYTIPPKTRKIVDKFADFLKPHHA